MRPAVCAMAAVSLPRTSALSGRSSRAALHADPAAVLPHWQEAVHMGSLLVHCCGNRTQLPRPLGPRRRNTPTILSTDSSNSA